MDNLSKMWSNLALRGGMAIALGAALLLWPEMSVKTLLMTFGLFALFDGFATMKFGLSGSGDAQPWAAFVWEGTVGMILGAVTVTLSQMGEHALLHVISAWFLWVGISKLVVAIRLRREVHGELLIILAGLIGVGIGLGLYFYPLQDATASVQMVGAGALGMGIALVALSVRLDRLLHTAAAAR